MSVIFFLFIFSFKDIFFWKFIVHHEERKLPVSHIWFLFIHLICIHNDKLPCNLTCNFMQMWRACKSEHSKIEMEDYFETLKLFKPRLTFKSFLRVPHVSQSDSFLISLVTRRRKFLIFVFLSLTFNFCHHSNQLLHSLSLKGTETFPSSSSSLFHNANPSAESSYGLKSFHFHGHALLLREGW